MTILPAENLLEYRKKTFQTDPELKVKNLDEALEFVNRRGFIFFWPCQDVIMPSLWAAANGDRPVPDEHDDPGHITWDWKDSMLGKRLWYYGRILRRRNTIVSMQTLPYFYALSPNYGDYENDYMELYRAGTLTQEAKQIYEALLQEGPLDTLALKKKAHLQNTGSESRFNKALDDLQMQLKITPTGVARVGSWKYAFIYDITPRHLPGLVEQAGPVTESQARSHLLNCYFLSVGAARLKDITKIFKWRPEDTRRTIESLKQKYAITDSMELSGSQDEWLMLTELTPRL